MCERRRRFLKRGGRRRKGEKKEKEVGGIQREAAVYLKQVAAMLRATPLIN